MWKIEVLLLICNCWWLFIKIPSSGLPEACRLWGIRLNVWKKERLNRKERLLMWKVFCIWTAVQVAAAWVQVTHHRHSTNRCNPAVWFMRLLTSIREPAENQEMLVHSSFSKRGVTADTRPLCRLWGNRRAWRWCPDFCQLMEDVC